MRLLHQKSEEIAHLELKVRQLEASGKHEESSDRAAVSLSRRLEILDEALEASEAECQAQKMQIATLESQVASLVEDKLRVEQQITTERELNATRKTHVDQQIAAAQEQITSLEQRLADTVKDSDFYKKQYDMVKEYADEARPKLAELSEKEALARSRLEEGLHMVKGTFEGQVLQLQQQVTELQELSNILIEKDRRTDDLRTAAARVPDLEAELGRWQKRAKKAEKEVEQLQDQLATIPDGEYVPDDSPPMQEALSALQELVYPCKERLREGDQAQCTQEFSSQLVSYLASRSIVQLIPSSGITETLRRGAYRDSSRVSQTEVVSKKSKVPLI
jgi:DNA repair exonuclease SbcCD ATPase subunit